MTTITGYDKLAGKVQLLAESVQQARANVKIKQAAVNALLHDAKVKQALSPLFCILSSSSYTLGDRMLSFS